jgi:hypothetical protein
LINASWSRVDGEDCIRVSGHAHASDVQVRPRAAADLVGHFPPMAGRTTTDGCDLCFFPRFAFVDGTVYEVSTDGVVASVLLRHRPRTPSTTEVLSIHPGARQVPRNLLRVYIVFSQPMGEGYAAEHLRFVDGTGAPLHGALLPTDYELWDGDHRRLTVLLDPARIKRGLVAHEQAGYPLEIGRSFRIVVDRGFRDACGTSLRVTAGRDYEVGADERRRVDPGSWTLRPPRRHSVEPVEVIFDRPLDYGLLTRCLRVVGPAGRPVDGTVELGPDERSWRFVPSAPWRDGWHEVVVNDILEDVAGNSVRRVFDRDRTRSADALREKRPFVMGYSPC